MRTPTARSVLLVVAVAALVALAGCSGGGDGTTTAPGDATDAPTEEVTTTAGETGMTTTESGGSMTATTAEETTTEEPSDGTTTTEEPSDGTTTTEEPSDGGTSGDGLTSQELFGQHADAVSQAGSFTANVHIEVNSARQNLTANTVTYANIDTGNGYQRSTIDSSFFSQTTEVYTRGNQTWQRTNNSFQGVQYNYSTAPYNGAVQPVNTSQAASGNFQFGNSNLTWSEAGTATVNGIETTRYTANDISGPEKVQALLGSNVTSVKSVKLEAFVDGDGIVRRLNLEFVGETQRTGQVEQRFTYELTDVGSTTVPTPDWLDEARQQTGS